MKDLLELRELLFDAPIEIKESWNKLIKYFDFTGFLMAKVKFPEILTNVEERISVEDLNEKGFENEPHVTILPRFSDNIKESDIKKYLPEIKSIKAKITGISAFHQKNEDILKYDVESEDLINLNKRLTGIFGSKSEYEYHPHITIAYLRKGVSDKYTAKYDTPIDIELESYIFSIDWLTTKL